MRRGAEAEPGDGVGRGIGAGAPGTGGSCGTDRARDGRDGPGARATSRASSHPALRAALLAAIALAYANAFAASFQFDDWDVIVRDPRVQSLSAWWDSMPGIRPLLKLSYALDHASGFGPVGFHATNVAIHALAALLVLELALVLTHERLPARGARGLDSDPGVDSASVSDSAAESTSTSASTSTAAAGAARDGAGSTSTSESPDGPPGSALAPTGIAFVAALVFALHPVQTEAVTYASGRSTSLSTTLALASLLVWVRGRRRMKREATTTALASTALSIGLMGLALAVKESAVVVPALIALWVASDPAERRPGRAALRACAPHALALGIALGAVLALPAYRGLARTSFATRSPLENLVAQTEGLAYLAGQLVRFDRLNADPAIGAQTRLDAGRAAIGGTIALVLLGAVARLRRRPLEAFAVVWTFVWLAPTNSFVARLDLVNDRQLYGALLGPALLFARAGEGAIRRLGAAGSRPRTRALARGHGQGHGHGHAAGHGRAVVWAVGIVALVAVGLGLATHRRNAVYRDELVFWQDVTRKSPGNARAFNNLGFALAERCALDEAEAAWRRALALDPELVRAAVNLRLLREGAGQAARCRAEAR